MHVLCSVLVTVLFVTTAAQSVAQQCLAQQIRNTNPAVQNQQNGSPEGVTMAAFDSICRNKENYVNCFQNRLPASINAADRFLGIIFSRPDMERAYRGLCTLDLGTLRGNIRCLLSTAAVRACYNNFNQGVNQVINLENQNLVTRARLQELACNVSVTRYQCEIAEYSNCDIRTGQIMQDFFFANIPAGCRTATGVRSRYVNLFNGASSANGGNIYKCLSSFVTLTAVVFMLTVVTIISF